jgi:hypothetical protein
MDLVFTTEELDPAKRFAAWQDAICDHYVHVDVNAVKPADYQGFIREAQFGPVTMSDVFLSEQRISRRERHIASSTRIVTTSSFCKPAAWTCFRPARRW